MIGVNSIEAYIKYAKDIISSIKSWQSIVGTRLELQETFSQSFQRTIAPQTVGTLRIVFAPAITGNKYAELGVRINIDDIYTVETVSADPSYANSTSKAWLITIPNTSYDIDINVNVSASVVAPTGGTITGQWL